MNHFVPFSVSQPDLELHMIIVKWLLCAGELSFEEGHDCNGKGNIRETRLSAKIQGNVNGGYF